MEHGNDGKTGPAHHPFCNDCGHRRRRFDRLFASFGRQAHIGDRPKAVAPLFLVALLIGVMVNSGQASARDYGLVAMNFDLWCQEDAGLPVDRCDQRTAVDEQAFEDFQHEISPYEDQNLREAQQEQRMERDFLDNDPIDNPAMEDPLAAIQSPLPRSTMAR